MDIRLTALHAPNISRAHNAKPTETGRPLYEKARAIAPPFITPDVKKGFCELFSDAERQLDTAINAIASARANRFQLLVEAIDQGNAPAIIQRTEELARTDRKYNELIAQRAALSQLSILL